ncbi:SpoIIE family protein phosphatase [Sphaerisporangium sp. TRM90804]|uniref:SpoIIE family protein phosphatase n=1 Tax=Sphaerisporangium sp. TRM90804 TaxID=3031113 RepID=UPI0024495259|nr:SpoIIE family protein phosphatase [Sphaerisporangium sp. TRM90804]MDH2428470.1 SpoIIE family protein phosphatase [Sphaerisporangium sp. TRM90804]
MTDLTDVPALEQALSGLTARISSLRDARAAYPGDPGPTLDAALAELDTARDLLRASIGELGKSRRKPNSKESSANRELKLLRAIYRMMPVPVIILDTSGMVRRVNAEASRLLGSPDGYLTGRAFPLLVDGSRRAAFRSHLTAVLRTGETAAFPTRLAHQGRAHNVRLVLTQLHMPGEPQDMIAAVALPVEVALPESAAGMTAEQAPDQSAVLAAARRRDMLSQLSRLLLDEESLSEPVALIRAGRLFAAHAADWVFADVVRNGAVRRSLVIGPTNQPVGRLVQALERMDPASAPLVAHVLAGQTGVVHEMVEDDSLLGVLPDGAPVLQAMRAGSLLSIPISVGDDAHGVITLVRPRERPPFGLADLAVMEDAGAHIGLALHAQRIFQGRSQAADTLQTGVLPRTLPDVPGFEIAAAYHTGAGPRAIGGEFYDVFRVKDGWGFAVGGVVGQGDDAASVTAMVRGGLRTLSIWDDDPGAVIARLNDALVAQDSGMFVMVAAGFVRTGRRGRVRLVSAGNHPPAVVRPDGGVRYTSGGGMPLGIENSADFPVEEVAVTQGETLVLYSDGLASSRGRSGQAELAYGEGRLTEVLMRCTGQPATGVVKAVEEDHQAFGGGQVLDETTILALRRTR